MRWWLAMGFILGSMFPVSASPCDLHPVPAFDKGLVKMEPVGTSGLMEFLYDVDGDGQPDRALVFQTDEHGNFIRWPLMYLEGLDSHGGAAEVWIDREGTGQCGDIQLYWKRRL